MRDRSSTYQALRAQKGSFYEIEVLQGNRTYGLGDLFELKISPKLFDGSGPSIGNTYSSVCDMTLKETSVNWPRMAAFTVRMRLSSADGETKSEWLSMGTYYTDERSHDEAAGKLHITAYDGMLLTEQYWTDAIAPEDRPESWPITCKAWTDLMEDAGLIEIDSRSVIDETIPMIGLNTASTVRDVLKTIAAAHGGNWVMTFENKLRLVSFVNADIPVGQVAIAGIAIAGIAIVGKEDYDLPGGFTDYQNLMMRVQRLETSPELHSVTGVRLETDAGTVMAAGTKTGYVLQGVCNPADTTGVAELCLGNLGGYVYKPFEAGKSLLDPAAEIGDIVIIGGKSYQMMGIDWNLGTWPVADLSAAFEEEVNHEYNYLDESAKNYQKSIRYTDGKADELQEEIVAAETAIEQTAEAVTLTAQAIGAERVTQSLNLLHYPLSEEPIVTVSGLTFTYNYDGSVAVDGTATASVYTGFAGETELESGTYTFSVETPLDFGPASSYTVPLRVKVGSTAYNLGTVTERDGKKVYSTSRSASGNIGFVLAVNSGETVHAVLYPQIVSGSSLQDWQPPVGAAVSDRLSQLQASLRVTAQGISSEVSRATAAEAALIADVDVEYAKGTSSTVAPTSGWSTDTPVWEEGKYIWQRTKTVSGSGIAVYSTPTCIQGAAGQQGVDGIGVSAIVEQYYLSTSSTTQTGGSWGTAQPVWESGKYIWTRSEITWSDSTQASPHITHTDPVLAKAINGANETAYEVDQEQNYTVTKSKNLAPYLYGQTDYVQDGVTLHFLEDGSILASGTATATTLLLLSYTPYSLSAGQYCMSIETRADFPKRTGDSYPFSMGEIDSGGVVARLNNATTDYIQSSGNTIFYRPYVFASCSAFIIQIRLNSGSTYNHILYPQIVRGEDVMPWSPPLGAKVRLAEQMQYADSQITQTADGISLTVKKGNVISSINQSAEAITINANRLNLTGYITATDVSATGSTVINGSRISGGTLTLGGPGNGNGVLKIKNASGTDIVVGDKDGLRVTDGIIDGGNIDGATIIGTQIEFRGGTYGQKLRMSSESSVGNVSVYRIKADYSGYGILDIYADSGSTYGYSAFGVHTNSSGGIELDCDSYSIRMDSSGIKFYRGNTIIETWT